MSLLGKMASFLPTLNENEEKVALFSGYRRDLFNLILAKIPYEKEKFNITENLLEQTNFLEEILSALLFNLFLPRITFCLRKMCENKSSSSFLVTVLLIL